MYETSAQNCCMEIVNLWDKFLKSTAVKMKNVVQFQTINQNIIWKNG